MSTYRTQSLLTIRLDTSYDLTSVTDQSIRFRKPNGERGEWSATISGQDLVYETDENDIDQAGIWEFQAKIVKGGRTGLGKIVTQQFFKQL